MSGTADVCFYGVRTIQGQDVDSSLSVNLSLDTNIEDIPKILTAKHGELDQGTSAFGDLPLTSHFSL